MTATVTIDNYGGGSITVTPDDYYSPNTPGHGYMKQGTIAVGAKKAGYCNNNGYCEATEADSCGDCVLSPVTGGATGGSGTGKFNKCVGDEPYLYVEDRIMEKGKTVEIPIIMCNARDLASMDLDWSYNASVLKIINVTKGSLNEKAVFV